MQLESSQGVTYLGAGTYHAIATLLICAREEFMGRDRVFENIDIKADDAFMVVYSLEVTGVNAILM
jgi:hypothetical protein